MRFAQRASWASKPWEQPFTSGRLRCWPSTNLVDLALIRYNPTHTGAKSDLFPDLTQPSPTLLFNFKSTLGFVRPARYAELGLNDDYWQPEITDYYRFALTRPEIDGLLCSPKTPREVEALSRALEAGPLDEEEEKYLHRFGGVGRGKCRLDAITCG